LFGYGLARTTQTKDIQGLDDVAKEIIEAADSGHWEEFTQKMGGVYIYT